ncbi:MAG: hypothetical protein LBN71_04580, partial [Tannerella sp.]|nr:hypothetical protein [Tannerella sp.]
MLNKWLQNDAFLRWRFFQSEKDQLFWDNFIKENPEAKPDIDEAIKLLKSVKLNDYKLSIEERLDIYELIQRRIDAKKKYRRIGYYLAASTAAACIALFLFLSGWFSFRPGTIPENTLSAVAVDSTVNEKDIRLLLADNQT